MNTDFGAELFMIFFASCLGNIVANIFNDMLK